MTAVLPIPNQQQTSALRDATEIVLALPDLYGRLQGTRLAGDFFREQVAEGGYGACSYLLSADVEMAASTSYPGRFGDFRLRPDLATLRPLPWRDATAMVLADPVEPDGTPVVIAPRQILRTQLDRLAARGLTALVGTELEFLVFGESYRDAFSAGYAGLRPASRFNSDYALTGLAEFDDLISQILCGMSAAGLRVESARGECHPGQYEIVFRYSPAMAACDSHVFYKTGAKQIAEAAGHALTFMPKYDSGEGNSCHVHLSLRDESDCSVFSAAANNTTGRGTVGGGVRPAPAGAMAPLMEHFLAGVLACAAEFTLLSAPTINAYKRLVPGAFAPSSVAWDRDDRTRAVRVIGTGDSLRLEHRIAGGDANPYLVVAGVLAAGLHGVEHHLPLGPPGIEGDRLPRSLDEAWRRWRESRLARSVFGDVVVDHLAAAAEAELAAFAATITDWERHRGFERL